jgi:Flp pilus assembly protein TadG
MATLTTDGRRPVRTGERGQAIVELALTLPLLLLILLGIFDFGLMFQRFEVIANGAREAARVAVLPDYSIGQAEAHAVLYLQSGGIQTSGPGAATVVCSQQPQVIPTTPSKTVQVMECTVDYDHQHVFVGQIMALFGGPLSSTHLRAQSKMRKEAD